jgi:hypothetical protein
MAAIIAVVRRRHRVGFRTVRSALLMEGESQLVQLELNVLGERRGLPRPSQPNGQGA